VIQYYDKVLIHPSFTKRHSIAKDMKYTSQLIFMCKEENITP
jgi:hypothetical protein